MSGVPGTPEFCDAVLFAVRGLHFRANAATEPADYAALVIADGTSVNMSVARRTTILGELRAMTAIAPAAGPLRAALDDALGELAQPAGDGEVWVVFFRRPVGALQARFSVRKLRDAALATGVRYPNWRRDVPPADDNIVVKATEIVARRQLLAVLRARAEALGGGAA